MAMLRRRAALLLLPSLLASQQAALALDPAIHFPPEYDCAMKQLALTHARTLLRVTLCALKTPKLSVSRCWHQDDDDEPRAQPAVRKPSFGGRGEARGAGPQAPSRPLRPEPKSVFPPRPASRGADLDARVCKTLMWDVVACASGCTCMNTCMRAYVHACMYKYARTYR